jgi:phosphatidylglycerophosphate synthase
MLVGLRRSLAGFPLQLPRAPLRSSVIRVVVSCLAVILVLAPVVASWTMSGADYIRRCLLFFVAAAIVVVGRVSLHHPFPRFGAANAVTLLRVVFAAGVAGLIGEAPDDRIAVLAVSVVVVVAALDGVDGWLARRDAQASPFGARFDMETDAAFILILSVLVWQHGKAGAWVLGCGLMRYLFVAAGWVWPWMAGPLRSTMRGKSVAIAQVVGLSLALLPSVRAPASDVVAGLTLVTLGWSFAVDIAWLHRQGAGRT